jgi:DMSO/TMAO reductase YedYZ heme-binding membrane subunit
MEAMDLVDLSAYAGLAAVALATANLLIGLLMAVRYSPVKYWPHRRFNIFYAHRITAYATITLTLIHPIILLFVRRVPFRVVDLLLPIRSPLQPLQNTLGAIALYLLAIVVVTSLYRLSIGRKWWKRTHLLVYPAAVLLFIHGVFTDSELKTGRADLLDGEKVFVEICFLVILFASLASIQIRRKRIINPTVTSISS